ncbi:DUF3363 domain-containing protein [uncultured Cohaesibacter sp.]|uniref:DUF3363 domain-containing protein n=1 Tax=uncultured Cohaesibacter sp. TaxID=1002546 RepID=UPI00292E12B2|nr:DUF3363 domain-containing protein [uncultured Cohaesibacter sp.]
MAIDDERSFRPKASSVRSDIPRLGKAKSFLTVAKKIARQHGNRPSRSALLSGVAKNKGRPEGRQIGSGVKRGRGTAFARSRSLSGGWRYSRSGIRRVIVKARYVREAGRNGRGAAHLRYIQRDGTARDGERGQLYSAEEDQCDGGTFLERGREDRHQFRLIVSPEDGTELSDLTGYTRDLMSRIEEDLGTRLDWVAVNHHNTGHPHVHVIIRGADGLGENLVINGDYLAHGIRERASEQVTLELGPVSELEHRHKIAREIDQDRFTRIDRALVGKATNNFVDLRHGDDEVPNSIDRSHRLRRLSKLAKMGLAKELDLGVWELKPDLEATLREIGERGDIIRTMQKALKAEGMVRDPLALEIHDASTSKRIVGRILDKYLSDELGDRISLVIDAIDGHTHHVSGINPEMIEDARIGSVIELGPTEAGLRRSDRAIATLADNGIFRPSIHLERLGNGSDRETYVAAHVRRLEVLRRAGLVERIDADHWRIPSDFEERTLAFNASRNRQTTIRVLSNFDLETQIGSDGATWLDRRLLATDAGDLSLSGFGNEVRAAMAARREHLIEQGDASRQRNGRILYRRNLLSVLQDREVGRVGAELSASSGLPFRPTRDGENVKGTFKATRQLASGKFALIEKAHEFTLVPWRPVMDRQLGQEMFGQMSGGTVSWKFGRQKGLGL